MVRLIILLLNIIFPRIFQPSNFSPFKRSNIYLTYTCMYSKYTCMRVCIVKVIVAHIVIHMWNDSHKENLIYQFIFFPAQVYKASCQR